MASNKVKDKNSTTSKRVRTCQQCSVCQRSFVSKTLLYSHGCPIETTKSEELLQAVNYFDWGVYQAINITKNAKADQSNKDMAAYIASLQQALGGQNAATLLNTNNLNNQQPTTSLSQNLVGSVVIESNEPTVVMETDSCIQFKPGKAEPPPVNSTNVNTIASLNLSSTPSTGNLNSDIAAINKLLQDGGADSVVNQAGSTEEVTNGNMPIQDLVEKELPTKGRKNKKAVDYTQFNCAICGPNGPSFRSSAFLYKHQLTQHRSAFSSFTQLYQSPGSANQETSGAASNKVECSLCGEKVSKFYIKNHMDYHRGRTFDCNECGMQFPYRRALQRHRRKFNHQTDKIMQNTHICNIAGCGKSFTMESRLKRHQNIMHNLPQESVSTTSTMTTPINNTPLYTATISIQDSEESSEDIPDNNTTQQTTTPQHLHQQNTANQALLPPQQQTQCIEGQNTMVCNSSVVGNTAKGDDIIKTKLYGDICCNENECMYYSRSIYSAMIFHAENCQTQNLQSDDIFQVVNYTDVKVNLPISIINIAKTKTDTPAKYLNAIQTKINNKSVGNKNSIVETNYGGGAVDDDKQIVINSDECSQEMIKCKNCNELYPSRYILHSLECTGRKKTTTSQPASQIIANDQTTTITETVLVHNVTDEVLGNETETEIITFNNSTDQIRQPKDTTMSSQSGMENDEGEEDDDDNKVTNDVLLNDSSQQNPMEENPMIILNMYSAEDSGTSFTDDAGSEMESSITNMKQQNQQLMQITNVMTLASDS